MWQRILPLMLAVTMLARPAYAQDEPADAPPTKAQLEAGRLYDVGLGQFDAKDFTTAAATFLEALSLDPNAVLAYNAAKAFENDGKLDKARLYYQRALDLGPDEALKTRIEDSLHRIEKGEARLREKLEAAAPTTGIIRLSSNKTATVVIDGTVRGKTPLELEVGPGTYSVQIRKANHGPYAQEIAVTAGGEYAVDASLIENSTALAWTGLGLAGGGLVLGGVGALAAAGARDKFNQAQELEAQRDPELFDQLRSDGEGGKVAANVLYGAGILLGGTGVTMLFMWWLDREDQDVPGASATLMVGPATVSVGVNW
jgi:tetratricopeptide (TPR) repeat protein